MARRAPKLPPLTWFDRAALAIAPGWAMHRVRARLAVELLGRHYEGAAPGRRTSGWNKAGGDANALIGPALSTLRQAARDLVRNNPYAESALTTIADHAVGWGITANAAPANRRVQERWEAWAETTACDADGRHDLYGLQKLVKRTVVESGEVLVRRRWRRASDGLPIPLQLQILDPDFLDTTRDTASMLPSSGGKRIVHGVQFDALGRREGYWLFAEHPGSQYRIASTSHFVPADEILHVFKAARPGQVRAPSWFAPVLLRFKDFDEFEDATLMKQKIAACLAVLTTDVDGTTNPLGAEDDDDEAVDWLEPGMIKSIPAGQSVEVVQPPTTAEYPEYSKTVLRAIATGLGVTYEDLTGDYAGMPFSAARMSRLRHEARVHDWRWRILIPQFCDPVWAWAMRGLALEGMDTLGVRAEWNPPPLPMVDPDKEGRANSTLIRTGQKSWSAVIRENGLNPEEVAAEIASDFARFDQLGLVLDCDPRKQTVAGQSQQAGTGATQAGARPPADEDDEDEDDDAGARARRYRH